MPTTGPEVDERHRRDLVRARIVSAIGLGWTVLAATLGLAAGLAAGSLVLVAFALAATLDALGSAALVVHFGRALRAGAVSERLERLVLVVVAVGMWTVAAVTVAQSLYRLATDEAADGTLAGVILAGVSVPVLATLGQFKASIGRRLPSPALRADSHLSRFGALLALITVAGTAATNAFGERWVDPVAALVAASVLFIVGATVLRDAARLPASER